MSSQLQASCTRTRENPEIIGERPSSGEIGESIHRAVGLLEERANAEGIWADFELNSSGESTSWVSSYVLSKTVGMISKDLESASLSSLIGQRQEPGGWGFSRRIPPDSDSTIHALAALLACSKYHSTDEKLIMDAVRFILSHQQSDGGLSTYSHEQAGNLAQQRQGKNERSYSGWTSSHVCVTAALLDAGLGIYSLLEEAVVDDLVAFLLSKQDPRGYWQSYWWRSLYYATSRIIPCMVTSLRRPVLVLATSRALDWIVESQAPLGCWTNGIDEDGPCVLSTAWALNSLVAVDHRGDLQAKAANWLVAQQNSNGSWLSRPCLRVPPPHVCRPEEYREWRIGDYGVGACSVDRKCLYTTATVLGALVSYVGERSGQQVRCR